FTPSVPWAYGALVQGFLDATATDVNGITVNSYQGSFTVGADPATTAPAVVATSPVNNATNLPLNTVVNIGYNVEVDPATVTATTVTLRNNGTNALIATTVSVEGAVIHLVPTAALAGSTTFCARVLAGVVGTNGQPAATVTTCFTTGTSLQPTAP